MSTYRGIRSKPGATRQWWLKTCPNHLIYPSPRSVVDDDDHNSTQDFTFLVNRGAIPSGLLGRVVVRLSREEDRLLCSILGVP